MERSYKIQNLVTTSNDENLIKKVIAVQFLLTVTENNNSFSGSCVIDVPFDDNIIYTPFDDLTEEQVMSWIDASILEFRLDEVQNVFETQKIVIENFSPPWVKLNIGDIDMKPTPSFVQEESRYLDPPPSFDDLVSNVVNRILVERD